MFSCYGDHRLREARTQLWESQAKANFESRSTVRNDGCRCSAAPPTQTQTFSLQPIANQGPVLKQGGRAAAKFLQERDRKDILAELKSCSKTRNLDMGKRVHAKAVEFGHGSNICVANALITMYCNCGSMVDAGQIFESLGYPTVVSWSALILGYAENGEGYIALNIFCRMRTEVGPAPNLVTIVAALKACSSLAEKGANGSGECMDLCNVIHNVATENGCSSELFVQNTMLAVYAKCGGVKEACQIFDGIKHPTVVSWSALILGCADNGHGHSALELFTRMRTYGSAPNSGTYVAALKACTSLAVEGGSIGWVECKAVHNLAIEDGQNADIYVQNTLIDVYAKYGNIVDARLVFDSMKHVTVVSWNALMLGYAGNGQGQTALDMFVWMPAPNFITFVVALKACTFLALQDSECRILGKAIHNAAIENGCNSDSYVQSTLIDMYTKCGSMVDAREVFDSVPHQTTISWNALILGYAVNRQGILALELFMRMRAEGPALNSATFVAVLNACGIVRALDFGRKIHLEIDCDFGVVLVTCLVDFYAKCDSLVEAKRVFDFHTGTRNVRTWTALLAGYSKCGDIKAVFEVFERMQDAGFRPDGVTFLCILTCCSHTGHVEKGKECFHAMSKKYGIIPTVDHYNCMIDMFGRMNKLDDAMILLRGMPCNPDNVTWMIILRACRKWGNVELGRLASHHHSSMLQKR